MPRKFPNDEQEAVLNCRARLTVVRAGPGSGKTRVFAEALKGLLANWPKSHAGIAALSFTNVAQEEIARRLGGRLPPPHFVGTLDSFLYRFVVRPFGRIVGVSQAGARLIPPPINEELEFPKVNYGPEARESTSIFRIHFTGGSEDSPEMQTRDGVSGKAVPVLPAFRPKVLAMKRREWASRGRVTHSDCHLLAASILRHPVHGGAVAQLLARRFPAILVDELQDTGWFLGRALVEILRCPSVTGLVVGDPDQAIYEFGGASLGLFDDIEKLSGVCTLPLNRSQRCPKRVAAIATALSASNKVVTSEGDAIEGRAILAVHDLKKASCDGVLKELLDKVWARPNTLAILARRTLTVRRLAGRDTTLGFKGSSGAGRRIDFAVGLLKSGEASSAAGIVAKELGKLVLDDETPTLETLRKRGIDLSRWRAALYKVLCEAARESAGETWNEWLSRVKSAIRAAAISLDWIETTEGKRSLSACFKVSQAGNELRIGAVKPARPWLQEGMTVSTIHQVKGAEFDYVVLFVPKPHKTYAPCPSTEWWETIPSSEERRVAYVAVSRTKSTFVLCVHRSTYDALRAKQPAFVAMFPEVVQ